MQERDLSAAMAAAPAPAEILTIADGAKAKVHSRLAGWLPDGAFNESSSNTEPPAVVTPDDRANESD